MVWLFHNLFNTPIHGHLFPQFFIVINNDTMNIHVYDVPVCVSLKLIPGSTEGRLCSGQEPQLCRDNATVPQSHL